MHLIAIKSLRQDAAKHSGLGLVIEAWYAVVKIAQLFRGCNVDQTK